MADIPLPVDPAEETFLSGVFAPVIIEHDETDLKVEGDAAGRPRRRLPAQRARTRCSRRSAATPTRSTVTA